MSEECCDEIEMLRQTIKEPSEAFWQDVRDKYGDACVIEAQHAWSLMADSILGENSKCVGRCKCGALFATL